MNDIIWFENDEIKLSGVGQIIVCLRQFRTKKLERKFKDSKDYEYEKQIEDFETHFGIKIFTDENLVPYYIKNKTVIVKDSSEK